MPKDLQVHPYIDKVAAYCRQHNLLIPGQIVVAVSGGADSLTLLHILLQLREVFDITLHVATLDHGIRGEAGAADVAFVHEIGSQWDVPVTSERVDVPLFAKQNKLGIEEAARKLRYQFLGKVALGIGAKIIAVAHNQNDQAETVLMHLLRGTGLKGLRGMLPKTELPDGLMLIRPLLELPRSSIELYIKHIGITPRTDETNSDTSYNRNHIRHDIIPFLERNGYPRVQDGLTRLADIAREDYEVLQAFLPLPQTNPDSGQSSISHEAFISMLPGQQRVFLRNAVDRLSNEENPPLGFKRLENARKRLLQKKRFKSINLGGVILSFDGENISLRKSSLSLADYYPDCPLLQTDTTFLITKSGTYPVPNSQWEILVEQIDHITDLSTIKNSSPYTAIVGIDEGAIIQLRTRKSGDRFKPLGMMGQSQKLQDTFVNMGVPASLRNQIPLLVINDEIAWFVAITTTGMRSRIAEHYAIRPDETRPVWKFMFRQRDK